MHNNNEIRKRYPKFVIATTAIITAVMLLGTTAISTLTTSENVFAYRNSQATSQINDCGNGELPLNVGCQNTASQIQGDENAVALTAQQTFPEPPPEMGTLEVIKEVICPAGMTCPPPSAFQMRVTVDDVLTDTFAGSSLGIEVDIEIGSYSVDETVPTLPQGQTVTTTKSVDCSGTINAGESKTCTITNTFTQPPPTATLTVIKNVQCAAGQQCPNLPPPSAFTMSVFQDGVLKTTFQGSAQGTTVTLQPGNYFTGESVIEPPAGLRSLGFTFSDGCGSGISGDIRAGEMRTCTWTNTFGPLPT